MYVDVALIIITMVVMVYKGILHIVLNTFFSLAVSPQLIRKSVWPLTYACMAAT